MITHTNTPTIKGLTPTTQAAQEASGHIHPPQCVVKKSFAKGGDLWLKDWVREIKGDAILAFVAPWIKALKDAGFRIPEKLGFAAIIASKKKIPQLVSGWVRDTSGIGYRGVDELHRLLCNNERSEVAPPLEHVMEPVWIDTKTLPNKLKPKPR